VNNDEQLSTEISWGTEQFSVISADSDCRQIVEAGPGTGKTAVACGRLAHLINAHDIEPSNTWMISFTRTAVAEIRARLHAHVGDASFAIRIATVDSHAWSIHSGHDPNAKLTGTYEENIKRVIELLETDEDVEYELSLVEHVVIDEAQDLVGSRADLVEALIRRLSEDCGITVFADEAQAIYGFSDESNHRTKSSAETQDKSLISRLKSNHQLGFSTLVLSEIYRTTSAGLRKIFSEIRKEVLDTQNHRNGFHAATSEKIKEFADKSGLKWREMRVANFGAEDLILFRTRAEVLVASQFCDLPHKLRLSGYGATLPSWLAICFYDFVEQFLSENTFIELWSKRIENKVSPNYGPGEAWSRLLNVAGRNDNSIDMTNLRLRLGQARPPVELCDDDFGLLGPIVGTIHASKGREASNVILLIPRRDEFDDTADETEEARVLFVGATRAKVSLIVGDSLYSRASTLSSSRTFGWTRSGKTMIEVGRDGDISARGLVGRTEFNKSDAEIAQSYLQKVSDIVSTYTLQSDPDMDWRYRVISNSDGLCVGALSKNISYDLWDIVKNIKKDSSRRPPNKLYYVRSQGCSSIVLPRGDSELETLHEPWASSGFILAPRISAFPSFFFSGKSNGR
jgi:hypothetical protein